MLKGTVRVRARLMGLSRARRTVVLAKDLGEGQALADAVLLVDGARESAKYAELRDAEEESITSQPDLHRPRALHLLLLHDALGQPKGVL